MKTCLHYIRNFSQLGYLLLLVPFLFACETVVDIEIPFDKPQVTMNANLQNNLFPAVRLTYSKHILDNEWEFSPIPDAAVSLIHQNERYPLSFNEVTGEYTNLQLLLREGNTYTLEAELPGYEIVRATESIPLSVPIKQVVYQGRVQVDSWSSREDVRLLFDDPEGENYYEISADYFGYYSYVDEQGNTVLYENNYPLYLEPKNPTYERDYNTYGKLLIDDRLFEGQEANLELFIESSFSPDAQGGEIRFTLKTVSRNYFQFHTTYGLQWWNEGDPFAQPVQVFSNISNGIGILMAESLSVFKVSPPAQ
ncbi:DUF4249 domain-containing protein [Cyclobacterium xiamenense]|uniref:DUF4249 domain-containing protein n=1 Tax=Cyclobacterium xiamenense TaxID=1297121 RepID=UPI0012B99C46|nr:DUF4249 domain-containing protein [Cyclobacterium xiamenense]